jgi:anti-anti-sigma factor
VTISVSGELDLFSAPELERQLRASMDGGRSNVLVDLGKTEFLDSAGLGALVNLLRKLERAGGWMAVRCPKPQMRRVFELTGLMDKLAVRAD